MKDQSGPAFPHLDQDYLGNGYVAVNGMTKRELIAMGQMKAWRTVLGYDTPGDIVAKNAIRDADALLAELGRE